MGNHDFDFGKQKFIKLKNETNFPWLLTNVKDPETNLPLGETQEHVIIEHEGIKIGFIGLAELEWLETIASFEESDYIYESFYKSARTWCQKLREEGCELVIALTHLRYHNDMYLAEKVPDLDMILGGHDHFDRKVNLHDVLVCKSGTDFRQFSFIKARLGCSREALESEDSALVIDYTKGNIISHEQVLVTSAYEPQPEMQSIIDTYWEVLEKEQKKIVGYSGVELDALFEHIRSKETNLTNFTADVVRFMTNSEL